MINHYFDKVYLLNLFKRKGRRDKIEFSLKNHKIDYEVFNGCDGSVMDYIWKSMNNKYFSNSNYVGCAISHLSIYSDAIQNNYSKILILEDDIEINTNYKSILSSLEFLDWEDLFYLGYIPLTDDCSMWSYLDYGIQSHNIIKGGIFNPRNLWGLFSYGISNSLMKEMIEIYKNGFPMEIDRYFVNEIQPRGNSIAISPQIFCLQDDIISDNLGYVPNSMKIKSIDTRFAKITDYN